MGFLVRELLSAGLMDGTAQGVAGAISDYAVEPYLEEGEIAWRPAPETSANTDILRPVTDPFSKDGGLRMMDGPIGLGVSKVSAVKPEHRVVEAPAMVFDSQEALKAAFDAGKLDRDFVAVGRFQGPAANGMPELHTLTPPLAVLQDRGLKVALVTDGRMSGASGKVPSAIHVSPEGSRGGPIARIRDGDIIVFDAERGVLDIKVPAEEFEKRVPDEYRPNENGMGLGREMFTYFRELAGPAANGASQFNFWSRGD
jgi:phosphogluconate dehydratase